jgi:hypothetical protein
MSTKNQGNARFTRFWTIPDNPPVNPGCFIIPSYALKDARLPIKPTRAQIDLACSWWTRFPEAKLIMCAGDNQGLGKTNARVMAEYAASKGIPMDNIIEEGRSLNTWQNLLYSTEIINERHLSRPTIVALDLYTRRVVAAAKKQKWKEFWWISAFSRGEAAYGIKTFQTWSRASIFCYELMAMAYSKIVGWA